MAIRKRTIRQMSPVARKLAKLVNKLQSTTRRVKYLLSDIQDLEYAVKVQTLYDKEVKHVQPENSGGSDPEDLSGRKKDRSRHDRLGKPGDRTGALRSKRKPRNKPWKQRKEK